MLVTFDELDDLRRLSVCERDAGRVGQSNAKLWWSGGSRNAKAR